MSELETLDYDESPSPRTQEFYAQYSGNQQIQSLPENPARSTTPVAEQPSTAHCIDRQSSRTSSSPSRQAAPPTRGGSSNGHDEGNWGEPPARWRSTNTSQDAFHPFPPANRSSTRRTTGRRPPRYIDTYRPVYSPRPKAPEEHCDQALASAPLRHYEQPSGSRIADIQPRATVAQEAFDFVARIIAAADGIFGVRAHDRHHSYAQTWVVVPGDARAYSWFDGSLAASLPGVTLTGDSAHDPALRTLGAALQSLAFAEPQDRPAWQAQVNVDLAEALQRPGQGSIRLYAPADIVAAASMEEVERGLLRRMPPSTGAALPPPPPHLGRRPSSSAGLQTAKRTRAGHAQGGPTARKRRKLQEEAERKDCPLVSLFLIPR